ncbi:DUF2281 domain-containing protein [Prosthecobacter sp.]|uniref:DUF2281 domain-containing protein n=1 Tax=Prosthecobacter sp. TaxID=1965333 RepID=UPI0037842909
MTATLESDHKLSLSEDVLAQGLFKNGMEFRVSVTPSGAMILRPNRSRRQSLVEHLRGLQGLELALNRETLDLPVNPLKGFGCLKGKISMSADFDEPLGDFKNCME